MNQFSRYRPLVASLAEQALAQVSMTAPSGDAATDTRLGLPAARALLHDTPIDATWHTALTSLASAGEATGDARPLRSPGGQWRDVYHPLVVHLYLRSFAKARPHLPTQTANEIDELLTRACRPFTNTPDPRRTTTVSYRLWRALCVYQLGGTDDILATTDELLARDDARPPVDALHAQDDDEPLDFWTYRELAALHALYRLALLTSRADWHARAAQVASFHLNHTQPDYTTYEPWGLPAFAASVETSTFAEQQLHDATVHLAQRDGSGAVTIALLLADAFDAMGE